MSLGTRCHQLAMYVVYESPLQMLADSPSNYRQEPDAMAFLGPVPSVWDETRVLDGKIGDYVVVARRRGDRWYVGAMTNWTSREIEIDTGFLAEGVWTLTAFVDGPQAATEATDYRRLSVAAHRNIAIKATLAPGGGMVGVFVPRWGPTPLPPQ
jgi:alpha-glucosidase